MVRGGCLMDDGKGKRIVKRESIYEHINLYYKSVQKDFKELKSVYPFSYLTILPTVEASTAIIKVIAVSKNIIDITGATKEDLVGNYSKELWIDVPIKYKEDGCNVFGGKWIDKKKIPQDQQHFYNLDPLKGYRLCVGVPESFRTMENVILEKVRTSDHILTAYADYMSGRAKMIILKQYSHGDRGVYEYRKEKRKIPK